MSRSAYALMALASAAGAAGVIESAAAAHGNHDPLLLTSANFLMIDAAAGIAISGFALNAPRGRICFLIAGAILIGGGLLFCADLTTRVASGHRLFPFAAPIGGTLMIAGWALAVVTAIGCTIARRKAG
ncbi:MAG: DUF423 domain-containing protein [Methylovirgula sp.]|jgi:uncharacterized membrane protein YgdD (TMEM256/DUF423 family)